MAGSKGPTRADGMGGARPSLLCARVGDGGAKRAAGKAKTVKPIRWEEIRRHWIHLTSRRRGKFLLAPHCKMGAAAKGRQRRGGEGGRD
jgi:hypothetical protein